MSLALRTVYRLIDDRAFPAYRMGRVLRIRRADVDAWLVANQVEPGSLKHLYDPED